MEVTKTYKANRKLPGISCFIFGAHLSILTYIYIYTRPRFSIHLLANHASLKYFKLRSCPMKIIVDSSTCEDEVGEKRKEKGTDRGNKNEGSNV